MKVDLPTPGAPEIPIRNVFVGLIQDELQKQYQIRTLEVLSYFAVCMTLENSIELDVPAMMTQLIC